MNRTKLIFALLILSFASIVGLIIYQNLTPKNVDLVLSPSVATVKLDGTKTVTPGKFHVSPGKHTLEASYSGFETRTTTFTATSKPTTVTMVLIANAEGLKWLISHPEEQKYRQHVSGSNFEQSQQDRQQKTPLIKILPYYERYFSVSYGPSEQHPEDDTAVGIFITLYSPLGKQQALDWITKQGYDPNSLEIHYLDKTTPET